MADNKISLLDAENVSALRPDKRDLKLYSAILNDKNIKDTFRSATIVSSTDNAAGTVLPAESAAGSEIGFCTKDAAYELHNAVVESTGTSVYLFPYTSASGLEIPLDANVTDGPTAVEITNGTTARSPAAWTVGTDAFYLEGTFTIDDISDLDQMFFGFRKAEAYQAEPDNYDEMAAFHVGETGATVADGQINIATILNGGATSYTDTTETDWTNAGEHTLRINVALDGTVSFQYDGAAPTATATFKFDSGEVVVPFCFVENTSGSTTGDPGVSCSLWECGASKTNLG